MPEDEDKLPPKNKDEEKLPSENKDEVDLVNKVNLSSNDSPIFEDLKPYKEGSNNAFYSLLKSYNNYYDKKSLTNITLRKKYFNCSFALIFILVFGFIGTTILVCLCVKDNLVTIVSLVSSIGGLVPSVLILPKFIGRYIFNENEYDGTKDVIESVSKSKNENKKQ